jgi:hypothetical protein
MLVGTERAKIARLGGAARESVNSERSANVMTATIRVRFISTLLLGLSRTGFFGAQFG